MNQELIFSISNILAMAGWAMLIFAPRWRWTSYLLFSGILIIPLAIVYSVVILSTFFESEGGFGSLSEVSLLFQNSWALLAGWIHYLAFDLFVGIWEVKNAQKLQISHWLLIPCLVLTFLFGPLGWLLYLALRTFMTKRYLYENF